MQCYFTRKLVVTTLLTLGVLGTFQLNTPCYAEMEEMVAIAIEKQTYGSMPKNAGIIGIKKNGKWGLMNKEGKEIIPCSFDQVSPYSGGLELIRVTANKKYGIYDISGQKLINPEFTYIFPYTRDFFKVEKDKKNGVINSTGNAIIPLEMKSVKVAYWENLIMANKQDNSWGFYSLDGKELFTKKYKNIQGASDGMISVVDDKKQVGFIDTAGNGIIPPTYKEAYDFSEGKALVKSKDNKLFLIDKTGKTIATLPGKDLANNFSEGIATVKDGKTYTAIDGTGKTLFNIKTNTMQPFNNGIARIERKVSKMDMAGLVLSALSIAAIGGSSIAVGLGRDGSFSLGAGDPFYYGRPYDRHYYNSGVGADLTFDVNYKDYKVGYVDKLGNEIIPTKNDFNSLINNDKVLVQVKGKYGYVDSTGKTLVPAEYDDISYFTPTDNDVVAVKKDEKYAFYTLNKGITSRWYENVKPYSEGIAAVDVGENNWVYINRDGKRLGRIAKYKEACDYSQGIALVKTANDKYNFIDREGNKLLDNFDAYKAVNPCTNGLIPVKSQKGKWGFLDKTGKVVVEPIYDSYAI